VLVIFTDLDGTLLEEDGSLSGEVRVLLDVLRPRGVRVVPLTSKTRVELCQWLEELGGERWGSFENGAGLVTPSGTEILPGALEVARLRAILREVQEEARLPISLAEVMPDEELVERTGLPLPWIPLVRAREFDLPFCAPEDAGEEISRALERRPLTRLMKGNRFWYLQGRHDKADAARLLMERLRPAATIGLGDASNDVGFLRLVDHPVLVPRSSGLDEALKAALPGAVVAPAPAGAGWTAAVRRLALEEGIGG
jgi:mannosyl-3-phosphoglycerate phosphatase